VKITALAQRYKLFDNRAKILGLWQGRHDLLVLDEGLAHIGEHCLTVLC
jgi:hypothetical protein